MTTEVSRRSILARSAAGAAIAALPAAVGAAVQDPVFSAIELHREALRVYDETHQTFLETEDHPEPAGIIIGEREGIELEVVESSDDVHHVRWKRTGEMTPIVVRSVMEIEGKVPKGLSPAERTAWIEEKSAELRRLRDEEAAHRAATPRGVAYGRWSSACDVLDGLAQQLIATSPTTAAGVAAALEYWAELLALEDEQVIDECHTLDFVEALAEAARAIA
jgi:hypothetical protein